MQIGAQAILPGASQRTQAPSAASANAAPFSSALTAASAASAPDFTRMTRQEMADWMNGEIRGGRMSLDDSAPFLGMTMNIPVAAGQPAAMAADATRTDYLEKARLGIEGALSRGDRDLARRLQAALDTMHRIQGQI